MWFGHWTSLTSKSWLRCTISWATIFKFGKSENSISLTALEAIFIKTQQPILCRQKEFVDSLQIYNNLSLGGVHTKFDNHPIKIIHVIYFFFFTWKFRRLKKKHKTPCSSTPKLFSRWFLTRARRKTVRIFCFKQPLSRLPNFPKVRQCIRQWSKQF